MPRIPYPNIPNLPGVPNVLRKLPAAPPTVLGTAAGVAQLVRSFLGTPVWGIFKPVETKTRVVSESDSNVVLSETQSVAKRVPVVVPDSIRDFGYQREWAVTTAPTQNGAFVDFNRVSHPFEAHVRMTKGGTQKDRTNFLQQIEGLNSTQLYDIVTPEKTYQNCNLLRVEMTRRGEKGAYWLSEVDIYFREIRVAVSKYIRTEITQPKDASSSNPQNNGVQQGDAVTTSVPSTVGS